MSSATSLRLAILAAIVLGLCGQPTDVGTTSQATLQHSTLPKEEAWLRKLQMVATPTIRSEETSEGNGAPAAQAANRSQPVQTGGNVTAFLAAAGEGDLETVKSELAKGVDIEASQGPLEATALILAATDGRFDVVVFLLDNGANIEAKNSNGVSALWGAAATGELEVVRLLLEQGADLEVRTDFGSTPLWIALRNDDVEVAKLLLDAGAQLDVNAADDDGVTLLHQAAKKSGGSAMIALLVNAGADIDAQTNSGKTPLHLASSHGRKENAERLVELGADKSLKDQGGDTPADVICTCTNPRFCFDYSFCNKSSMKRDLFKFLEFVPPIVAAAGEGDLETVKSELGKGVDIESRDCFEQTALILAARDGRVDVVAFLLDNGANIEARSNDSCFKPVYASYSAFAPGKSEKVQRLTKRDLETTNESGSTPLWSASHNGHVEVVQLLIDAGTDLEARNDAGSTPLFIAAKQGHLDVVKLLLDNGADMEKKFLKFGATPLIIASGKGHVAVVEELIQRGAELEAKTDLGATPVWLASQEGQVEVVQRLIDAGVDLEARTDAGSTPLFIAAQRGHLDVVKLLLDNGADMEAKFLKFGSTPLIIAASEDRADVVEELLSRGANANAADDNGVTPLHEAAESSRGSAIITLLVNGGAAVDAQTNVGSTPLHFASRNGQKENAEKLVDLGADTSLKNQGGDTPADVVCTCEIPQLYRRNCNGFVCRNSRMDLLKLLE